MECADSTQSSSQPLRYLRMRPLLWPGCCLPEMNQLNGGKSPIEYTPRNSQILMLRGGEWKVWRNNWRIRDYFPRRSLPSPSSHRQDIYIKKNSFSGELMFLVSGLLFSPSRHGTSNSFLTLKGGGGYRSCSGSGSEFSVLSFFLD